MSSNKCFSAMSDDSSEDISDATIKKLIIVTLLPPSKRQYDRTGDYTTRAKMNQSLNEEMEYGLRRYEDELWNRKEVSRSVIYCVVCIVGVRRKSLKCYFLCIFASHF